MIIWPVFLATIFGMFYVGNFYVSTSALYFGLTLVIVTLVFCGAYYFFITSSIFRNINKLKDAAIKVAGGDFSVRIDVDSKDETGVLAEAINRMISKLSFYTKELEKKTADLDSRVLELERTNSAVLNLLEDVESARLAIEEEKERSEAILRSIGNGVLVTDEYGEIVKINSVALDMLGFKAEDMLGKPVAKAIKAFTKEGEEVSASERPITESLTTGKSKTIDLLYQRSDGELLPVSVTLSPIMFRGRLVGSVEIFRDITLEKKIDKAKTEFVSIASHQLRTPLSTINWYTEMLLSGDVGDLKGKQKEYLDEIYRGNQRMIDLINALLNVSRLEVGAFIVEPDEVDISKVFEGVMGDLKSHISKKNLDIKKEIDSSLPPVIVDEGLLRIILQNLMTNAVKYSSEGGIITLSAKYEPDYVFDERKPSEKGAVLISVSDNGIGIPEYQQDRIFTKLFRADNARETDPEGSGLGLYIIKSIIDQTGGSIWFESKEGEGATFYIRAPINWMKKKAGTKKII